MALSTKTPILDVVRSMMQDDDAIDYRAMMAREVFKERAWRMGGVSVTPAELARLDLQQSNVRETLERTNGEPL